MKIPGTRCPILLAAILLPILVITGCSRREARQTTTTTQAAATASADTSQHWDASVPSQGFDLSDPHILEQGRRDTSWRAAARAEMMGERGGARPGTGPMIHPRSPAADSVIDARRRALTGGDVASGARPGNTANGNRAPVDLNLALPGLDRLWTGQARDSVPVLTVQVWLDRVHFSPGVIDGRWGKNTAKALYWFQDAYGLNPTGDLDPSTFQVLQRLTGDWDPVATYSVTDKDLQGPFTPMPKDVYEKAKLQCLCYENPAEELGEQFHTTSDFLKALNRNVNLDNLTAGALLTVPHVDAAGREGALPDSIAMIVISKHGFYTHAEDAQGNVLFHFPSTLGSQYDPSPEGRLKVTGIAFNPPFHYQPKLFHDVPDNEPEAHLPAGPNSPVGLVWMQLSKENYGMHGTATPETIGYESSHGCVRLTNWDALFLARHVKRGVPVEFSDETQASIPGRNVTGGG